MSEEICRLTIDGASFEFPIQGKFAWGADEVLYFPTGVLSHTSWEKKGFNVLPVFTPEETRLLLEGTSRLIRRIFDGLGYTYPVNFQLEDYHKVVVTTEQHQEVINHTRWLKSADLPISILTIAERLSDELSRQLSAHNQVLEKLGQMNELIILRISRPQSLDINPPHRDGYLEVWKHTVNCWIPIVGCNDKSSLPVIPGSHYWNEKGIRRTEAGGATIKGLSYHVPAILETTHGLSLMRPNPGPGEMLVFSPFLVHGSAVNLNPDSTRFSFELRLFDKQADSY